MEFFVNNQDVQLVFEDDSWANFTTATGLGAISLNIKNRSCMIHEFSRIGPERSGYGRTTLQLLRQYFDQIDVNDPGEPNEVAWKFWFQMQREGFVNDIYDAETGSILPSLDKKDS
jgi:hypothetical protein